MVKGMITIVGQCKLSYKQSFINWILSRKNLFLANKSWHALDCGEYTRTGIDNVIKLALKQKEYYHVKELISTDNKSDIITKAKFRIDGDEYDYHKDGD